MSCHLTLCGYTDSLVCEPTHYFDTVMTYRLVKQCPFPSLLSSMPPTMILHKGAGLPDIFIQYPVSFWHLDESGGSCLSIYSYLMVWWALSMVLWGTLPFNAQSPMVMPQNLSMVFCLTRDWPNFRYILGLSC